MKCGSLPERSVRAEGRGYTLLELLVVIAIIGLLASITMLSLSRARAKARDVKRLADMEQIQRVLELYANDHQSDAPKEYPPSGMHACVVGDGDPNNFEQCWWAENPNWIPLLITEGYVTRLPLDPRGWPAYEPYKYLRSGIYGYIMTFKLESAPQQDECRRQGPNPVYSTRCGRLPAS